MTDKLISVLLTDYLITYPTPKLTMVIKPSINHPLCIYLPTRHQVHHPLTYSYTIPLHILLHFYNTYSYISKLGTNLGCVLYNALPMTITID